jgi:hypothetical protein
VGRCSLGLLTLIQVLHKGLLHRLVLSQALHTARLINAAAPAGTAACSWRSLLQRFALAIQQQPYGNAATVCSASWPGLPHSSTGLKMPLRQQEQLLPCLQLPLSVAVV